jgi:hypothetical protein
MLKLIVANKHKKNRFYEDHQETVWNHMRPQGLITDWMMIMMIIIIIMLMTMSMRMTLLVIDNIEMLGTLYVHNYV